MRASRQHDSLPLLVHSIHAKPGGGAASRLSARTSLWMVGSGQSAPLLPPLPPSAPCCCCCCCRVWSHAAVTLGDACWECDTKTPSDMASLRHPLSQNSCTR